MPTDADAVVLLLFTGNDLYDNLNWGLSSPLPPISPGVEDETPAPPVTGQGFLLRHSYLANYVALWRGTNHFADSLDDERYVEEFGQFTEAGPPAAALEATGVALAELAALCDEVDIPWAVILAPPVFAVDTRRLAPTFEVFGVEGIPDLDAPARAALQVMPPGVAALDLRPLMHDSKDPGDLYFRFDGHWTPEGHALAADLSADFLADALGEVAR